MIKKYLFGLFTIVILIISCEQFIVKYVHNNDITTEYSHGGIKVALLNDSLNDLLKVTENFLAFDYSTASKVVISITDSNNNLIYDMHEMALYNMNGQYITEQLTLNTGDYNIIEFLVSDTNNNIICAAPIEGSDKASLMNDPLPIAFSVVTDQITNVNVQVLAIDETSTPEEFGYTTFFSFEVIEPVSNAENLITNGDFSDATMGWTFWNNQGVASWSIENGECVVDISGAGTNYWDMGIGQTGFTIENGETYTLTFQAMTDTVASIKFIIQELGDDYTPYSTLQELPLTTNMSEYSVTFTMNQPTDEAANLSIFTGAQGTGKVYIDNVVLTKLDLSSGIDSTPCNPNATPEAAAVLKYIAHLSDPDVNQAMVGQNCYHGTEITDTTWQDGYNRMIGELYNQTGKWVSIAGVDYEFSKVFTPAELSAANQKLIEHWNKGGFIAITWVPLNPWIIDELDIENNPGAWDLPGNSADLTGVTKLTDLVDPTQTVCQTWRRKLDRIADALLELQNAGVVVLWRPLIEMNTTFRWWGTTSHLNDPLEYTKLFRDMYEYFTNVKGLNNLLWVYSPNGNASIYTNCKAADWAYPGDDVVDIIADICYDDNLNIESYNTYIKMGNPLKPIAMNEWGPAAWGDYAKYGGFDTRNYINKIKTDYPRIAYWVCWHSYDADPNNPESFNEWWSIITQSNYVEMMNDPDVITADKIDWQSFLDL